MPAIAAIPAALRLITARSAAGGFSASLNSTRMSQMFQKMMKHYTFLGGGSSADADKNAEKAVKTSAALVLGRTSRDVGVTLPKGTFSAAISKGESHVKRRYTWKRPSTRGRYAGQQPKSYQYVAEAIRINGRKFKRLNFQTFARQGAVTLVENKLTQIREKAGARVSSGKAAFYLAAVLLKLPTSGLKGGLFKDKPKLKRSLRSMGGSYRRLIKGEIVKKSDFKGYKVTFKNDNALNPHVRGIKIFGARTKGIMREMGTLMRKGYVTDLKSFADAFGFKVQ
jgi:hypothetical protein